MCSDFYPLSLPIRINAVITWFDNFNGNMAAAGNVFICVLFGDIWPQYCKDFLKVFGRHSCKSFKCLGVLLFNFA